MDQFLSSDYQDNLDYYTDPTPFNGFEHIFSQNFQETSGLEDSVKYSICTIDKSLEPSIKPVEISPGKLLYINSELDTNQQQKLLKVLQKQTREFAWEYKVMHGIHLDICIHHIYTQEDAKPVRQFQRQMNPALKDIVKEELQKLLNANFIYPIPDSKWVSPLVIIPKKNGDYTKEKR